MNRHLTLALLLAACLGLALRWPQLEERPLHNDEGVNAIKFGELWAHGSYRYDPNEHHGPTLPYATLALGRLTGAPDFAHFSESRLRLVTVLFGAGLILLLPLIADALGRRGTAWAAVFTAVSPALVFYSRYYIHELLLVFFTFLALGAGWRYWRTRKLGWALLAGAGVGLMQATKETFVITIAAAVVAIFLNHTWNRLFDASGPPVQAQPLTWKPVALALAAWLAIVLLFFSSFFTNLAGPLDAIRTYTPWVHRAGGESPHIHPWYFYLHRLLFYHVAKGPVWTEALLLVLAMVAGVMSFKRQRLGRGNASFIRFLALYAFLLMAFYSLLPYKTPWCLASFWHATVILAGFGAAILLRMTRTRTASLMVNGLLLLGVGHLVWQTWELDTVYAADRRNPYVYSQTSRDILRLVRQVQAVADAGPEGRNVLVKVIAPESDYWPLPYYLRDFTQTGWWDELPADPFAPIMIVSAQLGANLDEKKTHVMVGYFELRPRVFLELYIELSLWNQYLAKHPRPPDE